MPYGSGRRYNRLDKAAQVPVDLSAIPTYLCPRCQKVKSTATPFVELTALDDEGLFLYTKICMDCAKKLQDWMKNKNA